MADLIPYYREGDVLSARVINEIIRRLNDQPLTLKTGPGLFGRLSGNQLSIALSGNEFGGGHVAVVTTAITARSGATAGTGKADLYLYNGSSDFIAVGISIDVLSFSSTTGGIPIDTWIWVEKDAASNWILTAVDCGN